MQDISEKIRMSLIGKQLGKCPNAENPRSSLIVSRELGDRARREQRERITRE